MLSETIYKKMKLDREFNSSLSKASQIEAEYSAKFLSGAKPDFSSLNIAYHTLHKAGFELSILFSPRATAVPSRQGEFLTTVMTVARMGGAYIGNVISLIERSNSKQLSVKRVDKLMLNFRQMQSTFSALEQDVQRSLDLYIKEGKQPQKETISRYSKDLLKLRRAYFRVRAKLDAVEKSIDFSDYAYDSYMPLMTLMRSHNTPGSRKAPAPAISSEYKDYVRSLLEESNHYMNAVFEHDAKKSKQKRKDSLDLENTLFISNYSLPRDAVMQHATLLKSVHPAVFFTEDEFKMRPEGAKLKTDLLCNKK